MERKRQRGGGTQLNLAGCNNFLPVGVRQSAAVGTASNGADGSGSEEAVEPELADPGEAEEGPVAPDPSGQEREEDEPTQVSGPRAESCVRPFLQQPAFY